MKEAMTPLLEETNFTFKEFREHLLREGGHKTAKMVIDKLLTVMPADECPQGTVSSKCSQLKTDIKQIHPFDNPLILMEVSMTTREAASAVKQCIDPTTGLVSFLGSQPQHVGGMTNDNSSPSIRPNKG